MEKVVYFLGAGFSAPFGIPVMSNFLEKSKDMYSRDSSQYKHFSDIFNRIDRMAKSSLYYSTDVFNIEETLSILEMEERMKDLDLREAFMKYIGDVIDHHAYKIEKEVEAAVPGSSGWYENLFGRERMRHRELWNALGFFVASIHNLTFLRRLGSNGHEIRFSKNHEPETSYSLITVNYDLLLEDVCRFINRHYTADNGVDFAKDKTENEEEHHNAILAKLHGSIDTVVIAPTWNKSVIRPEILNAWKLAYKVLVEANHIRIIGYSLPITDTYVRYLLKSAAINAFNLKTIDVICLDPDGSVEAKYREFINLSFSFRVKFLVYSRIRYHNILWYMVQDPILRRNGNIFT